jgi:magnesium-transporting ATPase (P-type)
MASELGNIATLIQETAPEKTVLQKKLASLSVILVLCALGLIALVAVEGWFLQGRDLKELFITAVSMAVAAIPDGLPAVVTIALAMGAQRILRRRALIRKLPAVETLGSVTVICSDKTGTLTQNRMTVTILDLLDHQVEFSSEHPDHDVQRDSDPAATLLLSAAALCNDAVLKQNGHESGNGFETLGDPTESALVSAAARGIRPVMITGDHPLIARNISGQLGFENNGRVLAGGDLSGMEAEELVEQVGEVSVYARVAPEHKLKIFDALQERGHIVAMTGDGVNDAPALKSADIGVAMGITGTDVSKEAAAMVLQDDNFATIVAAVEEGRIIFDNILRFVR